MTVPLLEVTGLHAGYGPVAVLRDVSLTVAPGEVVGLLGPNGAGKTTTLLTISGLVHPTAGTIALDGAPLVGVQPYRISRRGVAHVPEDRSLFFGLSVAENLWLANRSSGIDPHELFPELRRLARRKAGDLSGGEQQMLALARALLANPRLLLVDEMSLGLAPVIVQRLFATLRRLAADFGIGVLVVEQHVHLALTHADRAYVLSGGRITASGPVADLRERWDEIESSYLGAA